MSEKKLIEMRGNHIVVRMLEELGVKTMFAYPGGFSLELHQALSKSPIRVILPRNEQGGALGRMVLPVCLEKLGSAWRPVVLERPIF